MHELMSNLIVADTNLTETVVGVLPLALFLLILYFLWRRQGSSPAAKLQREYLQRQIDHMPKIESLLERIANALERKQ